jgi:crotonobetainyl-CoA:carnitine CoA-transferase CaiB-like acyl-CoA transferase
VPQPLGSSHPSLTPYRTFRCRDGQWVFIAGANDRFWSRLAPVLGVPDMATDPRFATNIERVRNRKELESTLEDVIGREDRATLLERLDKAGVPAAPVNTVDQVMNDAQTLARELVRTVVHPKLGSMPVIGLPLTFSRVNPGPRTAAPMRGEHTDEILRECGYSAGEIASLRTKKAVL